MDVIIKVQLLHCIEKRTNYLFKIHKEIFIYDLHLLSRNDNVYCGFEGRKLRISLRKAIHYIIHKAIIGGSLFLFNILCIKTEFEIKRNQNTLKS